MPSLPRLSSLVPLAVAALLGARVYQAATRPPPFDYDAERSYRVVRVIDGDTLLLEPDLRVRLLGVDTPETKHPSKPVQPLGEEATRFTRDFVSGGVVRLEFDRERRDAVRRVLAYLFVGERCLNEELIRTGYSRAETRFPYSEAMKRRFRRAEEEARAAERGRWSRKDVDPAAENP